MKPVAPPRVTDVTLFWTEPPPARTARCDWWLRRIAAGWRRNKRVGSLGYHSAAEFYGVYIWEYINVLAPVLIALYEKGEHGGAGRHPEDYP